MQKLNIIPDARIKSVWYNPGTWTLQVMFFTEGIVEYDPIKPSEAKALEDERTDLCTRLALIVLFARTQKVG